MKRSKPKVSVNDWGTIDYEEAWTQQTELHKKLVNKKLAERNSKESEKIPSEHQIIFCEHPHVYTIGKSGKEEHLLLNQNGLVKHEAQSFKINRGGDITYHGPGQLVVYPILDLDDFFHDVHRYVRNLEEVIIRLLATYGIASKRMKDYTGVWVEGDKNEKICAIGVHLSRWVSLHGLAFNVNTNLSYFDHIIPCGIQDDDKTVTSLGRLLNKEMDMSEVKERFLESFAEVFECQLV